MNIFLLEDDVLLNDGMTHYLQTTGHQVCSQRDGNIAKKILIKEDFDLLILDINVPGIDGLSLLEWLHKEKIAKPTIYISALVNIEDISRAFDLGCYDYLKKPFHLKELTIRINNLLKTRQITSNHKRLSKSYSFDLTNSTLLFNNTPVKLRRRQLQVIELLAKNRGLTVDFDMFRHYIWDDEIVQDSTITSEIYRLKKSLKEDFIINIRNIGYIVNIPN